MEKWQGQNQKEEYLRLYFIGKSYSEMSKYEKAFENLEISLQISLQLQGEEHIGSATIINHIG